MANIQTVQTDEVIVGLDVDEVQEALAEFAKNKADQDSSENSFAKIEYIDRYEAHEASVKFTRCIELDPDEVQEALAVYAKRKSGRRNLENACAEFDYCDSSDGYTALVTFTNRVILEKKKV